MELSFAKNIGKNLTKNLSGKYTQKLLDHATDALKTTSKRVIQKTAAATGDLMDNKIADAVAKSYHGKITRKFQEIHNKIIQGQLQISMIKKYLKKYIHLQKKDSKLFTN